MAASGMFFYGLLQALDFVPGGTVLPFQVVELMVNRFEALFTGESKGTALLSHGIDNVIFQQV